MALSDVTDDVYKKIYLAFGQGLEESACVHSGNPCSARGSGGG